MMPGTSPTSRKAFTAVPGDPNRLRYWPDSGKLIRPEVVARLHYQRPKKEYDARFQSLMAAVQDRRVRIAEFYSGIVVSIGDGDEIVVQYETDGAGDRIEHSYRASQFLDKQPPSFGERLDLYAYVVTAAEPDRLDVAKKSDSEQHREQIDVITEPHEF